MTDDAPPGTEPVFVPGTMSDPARECFAALSEAHTDVAVDADMAEPLDDASQPVITPAVRAHLRHLMELGTLDSVLESPMPAAKRNMPPPAARSPVPARVTESPVTPIIVEDEPSPGVLASEQAGPSLAQRASGQNEHELSEAIERAMRDSQPVGWPPHKDLAAMELDSLYAYWRNANLQQMTMLYREIQVQPAFVPGYKVPTSLAGDWKRLWVDWRQAKKEAAVLTREMVISKGNLEAFWAQPMCPEEVMPALMSYRAGDDENTPQWPRITKQAILEVFPNLEDPSSSDLQYVVLRLLRKTVGFQPLLQLAWDEFQMFREAMDLAQVPDNCLTPELRLENDRWNPGSAWTRPNLKGWAWKQDKKATAPSPVSQAESGEVIPGIHPPPPAQHTGAPPAQSRSQSYNDIPHSAPRTIMDKILAQAAALGQQPDPALCEWALVADQQNERGTLPTPVPDTVPAIVPNMVPGIVPGNTPVNVPDMPAASVAAATPLQPERNPVPAGNPGLTNGASDLQERMTDSHYDPAYDNPANQGGNSTNSASLAENTLKATKFLEQANVINPDCPLPVITGCREATSDYLLWGLPLLSDYAFRAFERKHYKEYKPSGPVSWENWTFSIRQACKQLNLTHDQAWRLATRLLPEDLQRSVEDVAMEVGFKGFCWTTWKELVGKATNQCNSITEAKIEMGALAFTKDETIPQFLQRFTRIVQKATSDGGGIEDVMTPWAVLGHLNRLFTTQSAHGPKWMIGPFRREHAAVVRALKTKNTLGISDSGKKFTSAECNSHIRIATAEMIEFLRSEHENKKDTENDMRVLLTNTSEPVTTGNSNTNGPRNNGNRYTRQYAAPAQTAPVQVLTMLPETHSAPPGAPVQCRGTQRSFGETGVTAPPLTEGVINVAGPDPGHQPARAPQSVPRSERIAIVPPVLPEWANLPVVPPQMTMSHVAQATAEYGVVTFDHAFKSFKQRICAACGRGHSSCTKIRDCVGIASHMKDRVSNRAQYLWALRHNARIARTNPGPR